VTTPEQEFTQKVRGILFMLASTVTFSIMSGIVRKLAGYGDVHAFEIAFFRNFFGFLMFMPVLLRVGTGPMKTEKLGLLGVRSICNGVSMCLFFLGLAYMPLVEVTALNFTIPLFVTIGAVLFLREKLGIARTLGLFVGFAGALIIVRPGAAVISFGAILVLLSAAIWAVAVIDIKVLSRTESSLTITIYGALFNAAITLVFAAFVWTWPSWEQLGWLVGVGIFGTLGHLLFAQALKLADASLVSAFDFTKILWASVIGYVFFAEVPQLTTWIGAIVIFLAASYITWRERAAEQARRSAEALAPAARPAE
jgi:drug/metabolite transporter (DMT)-like permease